VLLLSPSRMGELERGWNCSSLSSPFFFPLALRDGGASSFFFSQLERLPVSPPSSLSMPRRGFKVRREADLSPPFFFLFLRFKGRCDHPPPPPPPLHAPELFRLVLHYTFTAFLFIDCQRRFFFSRSCAEPPVPVRRAYDR